MLGKGLVAVAVGKGSGYTGLGINEVEFTIVYSMLVVQKCIASYIS